MKLLEFLNEGKQLGTIYHFTSVNSLLNICLVENELKGRPFKHNKFILNPLNKDVDIVNKHNNFYKDIITKYNSDYYSVSFTRDKFLNTDYRSVSSMECRMVIDGDKLSNKYKFMPYQFNSIYGKADKGIGDEREELCLIKNNQSISNILAYIDSIELFERYMNYYDKSYKFANYFRDDLGYGNDFNLTKYMLDNNLKIERFTENKLICDFFKERLDIISKEFKVPVSIVKK